MHRIRLVAAIAFLAGVASTTEAKAEIPGEEVVICELGCSVHYLCMMSDFPDDECRAGLAGCIAGCEYTG